MSKIPKSLTAVLTVNPIRQIVDRIRANPKAISLSIGDPTIFGNFSPPKNALRVLSEELLRHSQVTPSLFSGKHFFGYAHSAGTPEARQAVAQYHSTPNAPLSSEDIIMTSGCSQALQLAFKSIIQPGNFSVLLPRPGFSLYKTLADSEQMQSEFYDLLPGKGWEIDLQGLEGILKRRGGAFRLGEASASDSCPTRANAPVAALLLNNPSNPCGSNYSRKHLEDLVKLTSKYGIVVITDEIYGHMQFPGSDFHPFAEIAAGRVPVLQVGGTAKRFMIPGWRVGWVAVHKAIAWGRPGEDALVNVRDGLLQLSTLTLGPCSLAQALVPALLNDTDLGYHEDVRRRLAAHADIIQQELASVPGLNVIPAKAAMYLLVGIDREILKVVDDVDFMEKLYETENVLVLPGRAFQLPNFFRIVITPPPEILREACDKIKRFCEARAGRQGEVQQI